MAISKPSLSNLADLNPANWQDFSAHRSTALSLVVANLLPLLGVLFWGWSTFAVVFIYWSENVIIGLLNVLKIICCTESEGDGERVPLLHAVKLLFVPFFTFHYGMFCLVHGVFLLFVCGNDGAGGLSDPMSNMGEQLRAIPNSNLIWGVGAMAISHLYSFVKNYLIGGEYRRTSLPTLMQQPYSRVVVLHVAILFGTFATVLLGSSIGLLVLLVLGKTALDLALHLREHRQASENQPDDSHDGEHRGNDGFGSGA